MADQATSSNGHDSIDITADGFASFFSEYVTAEIDNTPSRVRVHADEHTITLQVTTEGSDPEVEFLTQLSPDDAATLGHRLLERGVAVSEDRE